ncbi:MAG: thiamine pyrophosphate-dependent dehydrogenase E1 component subunit alpha [Verrucomicrobiota bacterium]
MQGSSGASTNAGPEAARQRYLQAYRWMCLARVLEETMASLYRGGAIHGGVFMGRGQEALSVALGIRLKRGDVYAPLIRDQAGRLAFGETVLDALRTALGSAAGPMRGRDGNVHRGRPREGLYPMISHLGAMISVVSGALMARRMIGEAGVVGATCIGDGGTSTGAFHEAMNQATVEKLPLVVVIADNQYAYSTPASKQYACRSLVDRAIGYGLKGEVVDGTDLAACLEMIGGAVERARAGQGPQMIVGHLLRLCGHGEHDDASYVDPALKQSAAGRDCLKVAEDYLCQQDMATREEIDRWRVEAVKQVNAAVAVVQRESAPDPFREEWCALSNRRLLDLQHNGGLAT